jgi:hypothetical protein
MKFDWDAKKATANLRKHGVSFEEAKSVLSGPLTITVDDERHSEIENQEKTIGISARSRILVVIHTERRFESSVPEEPAGRRL